MPELHSLSFVWPRLLWLQLALPLLALSYAVWRWRARRSAPAWPGLPPTPHAQPRGRWRRHLPAALLLVGLALLLLAVARPRAILLLPGWSDAVMLVIDTSGSMRADDIKPSRIEAAQAAAHAFIDAQPRQVSLGIVSAAGSAAVVQAPTDDRDALHRAVDALTLQRGTALGSGLVIALAALLPGAGLDVQALLAGEPRPGAPTAPGSATGTPPAEPGSNQATAIVLLSDGQSNFGPDALKMAELAARHGVRVFTVGVGTPEGVVLRTQGMSVRVRLDEATLEKIAILTRADYFRADSRQDLLRIYRGLSRQIALQKHQLTEISGVVALLGLLCVSVAAAFSLLRHGRLV